MAQENIRDISLLRAEIDRIDRELVALFAARMQVSAEVAAYKKHIGMAVTDTTREAALLARVEDLSPAEIRNYTNTLYQTILSLSRAYQRAKLEGDAPAPKSEEK